MFLVGISGIADCFELLEVGLSLTISLFFLCFRNSGFDILVFDNAKDVPELNVH